MEMFAGARSEQGRAKAATGWLVGVAVAAIVGVVASCAPARG